MKSGEKIGLSGEKSQVYIHMGEKWKITMGRYSGVRLKMS